MRADVVVVGAGHSGLAMSRRLAERGVDHVVLERGRPGEAWRSQRWDSLRLLTPNWFNRLPGAEYAGPEPDGYLSASQTAAWIADYARRIHAPVRDGVTVTAVKAVDGGYRVETDAGRWRTRAVVLAAGACTLAAVPDLAAAVPAGIAQLTALDYRSPADVPEGRVLIVGASASGVQLADELARAGRSVTLSVGEHVRMPRRYRGRDVFWWLDAAGVLDERYDELEDVVRARHVPSPQLVGSPDGREVDLAALQGRGVRLAGRLGAIRDGVALFSGGLANAVRLADLKLERLLDRFDDWAAATGIEGLPAPDRPAPTRVAGPPLLQLDLRRANVGAVLWATGYRPDHSWLHLPVFDARGRLRHDGGVVPDAPGVFLLGGTLLRRRRSSYLSGAAADSAELTERLVTGLAR